MAKFVRPRDGSPVALRPCPPWCTLVRHFGDGQAVYADDGYHHVGAEAEVPTGYPFLGLTGGDPTIVRAVLKSWTHPLGARPGHVLIELNLGTLAARPTHAWRPPQPRPAPLPGHCSASRTRPSGTPPRAPPAPPAGGGGPR